MNKNMVLVAGKPATGKTASLRNLPKDKTAYLNADGKRVVFGEEFDLTANIKSPHDIIPTMEQVEEMEGVEYVVLDTLSFMMEMFETQVVNRSSNTQQAWGEYADFYKKVTQKIKNSGKKYVVLAHLMDVYNEDELVKESKVPVKGSVGRRGVEADYDIIVNSVKVKDDSPLGFSYKFQTQLTKETMNTNIRHPIGFWKPEEVYIDNDVVKIFEQINKFYNK